MSSRTDGENCVIIGQVVAEKTENEHGRTHGQPENIMALATSSVEA